MWSIAPLGNEIRYRVIARLLSRRPAPAASQPCPSAVETDKPPTAHRCSGRSGLTASVRVAGPAEHSAQATRRTPLKGGRRGYSRCQHTALRLRVLAAIGPRAL